MATQRQKKLAKAIVENAIKDKPETAGQLLENVGYSQHLVKQPGRIINQEGVKEELAKYHFTLEEADNVVARLLSTGEKEETQIKAADLIYKRLGGYAPEKSINVNVQVMDDQAISDLAIRLNKEMTNEVHEGNGEPSNGEVSGTMAQEVRYEDRERPTT
jgi:hypothetical protein